MCAGQKSGVEAAIHAARTVFADGSSEGLLLVDASNAFNSLNHSVALHTIQYPCPSFGTISINTYRSPAVVFVDGVVLYSIEGITLGDPLAMPFYALATIPLIQKNSVIQVWYADDASACGSLRNLRLWWDRVCQLGPQL